MEQKDLTQRMVEVASELSTLTGDKWGTKPNYNTGVYLVGKVKDVIISPRNGNWGTPKG